MYRQNTVFKPTYGSEFFVDNLMVKTNITASNVSFNGSGPVELSASIDANTVGASELKVGANGTSGQVLASDGDGTFSWVTRDNYSSWTAADGASSPTSVREGSNVEFSNSAF